MVAKSPNPDPQLLCDELMTAFDPAVFTSTAPHTAQPSGKLDPAFIRYFVEERPVAWEKSSGVTDRLNHLMIGFAAKKFALVYISDSLLKNRAHDILMSGKLSDWEPVEEGILVTAFLLNQPIKALWLGGTHRSVDVKANSKIVSGGDLREALDPFGDNTFVAGAARAAKTGISLKRSGLWRGPHQDWASFCESAQLVIDDIALAANVAGAASNVVHSGLARVCKSWSGVKSPYQVEWADPDTLRGAARARKLGLLIDEYQVDLVATGKTSAYSARVNVKNRSTGKSSTLEIAPPSSINGPIKFKVTGNPHSSTEKWKDAIEADAELIRIYYDSGHTISNASLSVAAIEDREFTDIVYGDFSDAPAPTAYDIHHEKPPHLTGAAMFAAMLAPADRSLFQWVFKHGLAQLGLKQPTPGECWLYCDDRSGEVGDFVHLHRPPNGAPTLAVIHVKGAKSESPNRQISAGAYEVVVGQAIKNLRRMLAQRMVKEIASTLASAGDDRTWDMPWGAPQNATAAADFSSALGAIQSQCNYEVIVVQPQVLKMKYLSNNGAPSNSTRAQQLRGLLFGAKVMANAAGAKFRVVFDRG